MLWTSIGEWWPLISFGSFCAGMLVMLWANH